MHLRHHVDCLHREQPIRLTQWCVGHLLYPSTCILQEYQQSMNELDAKLNRIADFADELKQLKTKHEMTAAQNANMFVKLQVGHVSLGKSQPSAGLLCCSGVHRCLLTPCLCALSSSASCWGGFTALLVSVLWTTCTYQGKSHRSSASCASSMPPDCCLSSFFCGVLSAVP